ncbi:PfkB family carbohydrate kinase [Streptomyces sp. NPDC002793]|uniref:PfkB family carbohydrate kinase n=1 Tax=Streptomyces sp. NPDC002793 TaxID=3154432 RepID=UPI003320ED08
MRAIAVLGSTTMDLVAHVPRAPGRGETVTGREFRTVPGGKGAGQAVAAARAGGDVVMIGAVGTDEYGSLLRTHLEHAGVDTELLHTVAGPSGTAHIVVDDEGASSTVVVPGANGTMTALGTGEEAAIAASGLLLLQLELPMAAVTEAARTAKAHGVRTILTPSPVQPLPAGLLDAVDLLIPDEHEAAALTGYADPHAAAQILLRQVPEVVITLGRKGCLHAARGDEPVPFPAPEVTAADTAGSGDTFVGTLAVALAEGRAVPEALAWASAAAALRDRRTGASTSTPYRSGIGVA